MSLAKWQRPQEGWHPQASLVYQRVGVYARITIKRVVNHELRDIIVGLWARLDAEDRDDAIAELMHYNTAPGGHLSAIASLGARAIADADAKAVDLTELPPFNTPDDLMV